MSSIRVRSYLDENAPQFDGQDKRAFIKFMKAMFESPSYNARVVSTITVNQTDKTISIPTTTKAGFSTGNLLKITGTLSPAFQTTYYRVIEASDTKLILSISNYSTVAYPASDLSNSILVEHAPLDWEVCYSTDTQFSVRSKDPLSSKNVITVSESKNPKMNTSTTTYTNANAAAVKVSKDINKTTGVVIDEYTSVTNAKGLYSESLHFPWNHGTSYTSSGISSGNVPWFIFSSTKFVYILVGSRATERNFSRSVGTSLERNVLFFGDPDFLGDPSYVDYGGYLLASSYALSTDFASSVTYSGGISAQINSFKNTNTRDPSVAYWMRPFEAASSDIETVSLGSAYLTTSSYNGGGAIPYPNGPTRGLLFFPIYVLSYLSGSNNSGGVVRSSLPFTCYCPNSLQNYASGNFTTCDYVLLKTYDGKLIMPVVTLATSSTSTPITSAMFFELD